MTERDGFTLFVFYGVNLVAAGTVIFTAFTHPDWSLAGLIVGAIALFVLANLMAAWQWLRSRRRPVAVLTRRYVCRKLVLADLMGAVLLLALYERGASLGFLCYVGGVFLLVDASVVAEYLWQRSFRARLRQRGQEPRQTGEGRRDDGNRGSI